MNGLYILSERLQERIREIAREADARSDHLIAYEEFVAVPYFGQIVLRFSLPGSGYTLDDLDAYESMLGGIAGEEFVTDFMGSVYRDAGIDYSRLEERLVGMNEWFRDEAVTPSVHAPGIRADAVSLLKAAGLDAGLPVWEIQAEEDGCTLILLGKENRAVLSLDEPVRITVMEADERVCIGLIRAAAFCRRNRISLARVLSGA